MGVSSAAVPTWGDISKFDESGDGSLHTQEFQGYLASKGVAPGTPAYEKAMQAFQLATGGDHNLSQQEFGSVNMGAGQAAQSFGAILASAQGGDATPEAQLTPEQTAALNRLDTANPPSFSFGDMNLDGLGGVTDTEFRAYLDKYGIEPGTPESDSAWAWFGQAKGDGNGNAVHAGEYAALPPPAHLTSMEIVQGQVVFSTNMSDPNQIGHMDSLNGYTFQPGQTTWQTPGGDHHFVGIDGQGRWVDLGATIDGAGEAAMHASFVAYSQCGFNLEAFASGAMSTQTAAVLPYVLGLDTNGTTASNVAAGLVQGPPPVPAGSGTAAPPDEGTPFQPGQVTVNAYGNVPGGRLTDGAFVGVNGNGEFINLGSTLEADEIEPWLFARGVDLADLQTNGQFDASKIRLAFFGADGAFDVNDSALAGGLGKFLASINMTPNQVMVAPVIPTLDGDATQIIPS